MPIISALTSADTSEIRMEWSDKDYENIEPGALWIFKLYSLLSLDLYFIEYSKCYHSSCQRQKFPTAQRKKRYLCNLNLNIQSAIMKSYGFMCICNRTPTLTRNCFSVRERFSTPNCFLARIFLCVDKDPVNTS